jgi:hypothetical protein
MKDSVLNGGNFKEVVSDFHLLHGNIYYLNDHDLDLKRRQFDNRFEMVFNMD